MVHMETAQARIAHNIFESLPLGLMVISPHGDIVMSNDALSAILDIPPERLKAASWAELFIEDIDKNTDFNQVILDIIEKKIVGMRHIVSYENSHGGLRRLCITSSFLQESEALIGIVLLIEDVTDKYEMLEKENGYLREIQGLQSERVEGLNKLAMAMAHQIRNPLMSIGGSSNLLLRSLTLEERERELFDSILYGAQRLESLVQAARSFASILEPEQQDTPLADILTASCDKANAFAVNRGRNVVWNLPKTDVLVQVDADLFERAVSALLFNAIDFSKGNEAVISIGVSVTEGDVMLTVMDQGFGVSPEEIPYVFDPFYSSKPDGVGMGLTVARRIIMEHRGQLTLASVLDGGTTATIVLPCADSTVNLCSFS
ncbi:PAS domain S-box protein [Pseudodesulfovibrio sp. JC047]|uniref:sensor histidine kinase n=1 Tax=Pseudodesulfovibrio sp. JC047 TaxID=2683199 RepID=UPI0013D1EE05|nr:ATP-binding protein [Pseudodesulfovibrio sp. JC047]NDV19273.1 PAS domain S-box protein [Pseudodesulfovibrio sp. JC047]